MNVTFFKHDQPTRKQLRAKVARLESKVKARVREQVMAREQGMCAVLSRLSPVDAAQLVASFGLCRGPLTWAHLAGARRSQTRGKAAEARHTTAGTLCLCEGHHAAEEHAGLRFVAQTDQGMDGTVSWTVQAPKRRLG